jgi:hypothetical protein
MMSESRYANSSRILRFFDAAGLNHRDSLKR